MRMMRALASLYVVATLLSLTPSLFASRFELTQLVLQVHAQVQSVPYNQPMYLGPDPTSNLATRGVYGNSAASAAETLQFQQSLLSSLGVRPGVQLVNAEAFNGLAPSQLQDQVLQKQYDIINQLQQQNPYLGYANRAAQSQQPQQQSQQPVQPQRQQQMMMQTQVGYVPAYLNNVNSPQAFGSINSQNNMLPPVQGNINNFATTQQQPPQQQFPIAQPQGFHSIATQQPQQQFQQQPFQQQQPPQQFQQSPLNMNQPYLPQQPQPQSQQPQQPSPMMPQQQSQQFQPQQPSFPQQPQQIPYQPGFANNAAAASNMPQFMAPPQFQNSASNNNNNNINAAATPPMQPPARLNSAASTPSAASTTTIASTPSPPVVRPATTSAVPPVATTTTPSASISSIPSTPPKPRPASCDDTDYHCQFYQSCYGCYGNHSLPYCGSCLALLQCNDDVSCQMMKAKAVCQQLSAAKEPQSQGCKQLMAMNN